MYKAEITLSPAEAAAWVEQYLMQSAEKIEVQSNRTPDGRAAFSLVFEDYYMRTNSRVGLFVMIDNLEGPTIVYAKNAGGKRGIFEISLGAGMDMEQRVAKALETVTVRPIE